MNINAISLNRKEVNVEPGCNVEKCKDRFSHLQKVLRDCWVQFSGEYLNELRQMNIYQRQSTNGSRDLVVGGVVLIKEATRLLERNRESERLLNS